MKKHYDIRIKGIVQGVGFRPFIHNLAIAHGILGEVVNDTEGVFIFAEGDEATLTGFIREISIKAPPLSYIRSVEYNEGEVNGYPAFTIGKSRDTGTRMAFYSPDIAVCDDCMREFFDFEDRRFHYPFITCINCGPRFSIVSDIPYDRPNTTMAPFEMCFDCRVEYTDHTDRRFHAQPIACPVCGPLLALFSNNREHIVADTDAIARKTVDFLKNGRIVAIKGVGGYHLAADALNIEALTLLRERKKRPYKPFALMVGDITTAERLYQISQIERSLLLSKERPIVLLKINNDIVNPLVAPQSAWHGVMLPYTPFQHLMFSLDPDMVLVMTSGNVSDEPIVFDDNDAFARLAGIADYFVTCDREVLAQSDDSVMFVEGSEPYMIRRGRGFVPVPFNAAVSTKKMLALGGDLKNSFAFARNDFTIMSQYLGDMGDAFTYRAFQRTVRHFIKIFDAEPEIVVSDLHPGYMTTSFADEIAVRGARQLQVQHHHAHIASVLEDCGTDERVIGIAFDGTGYGTDGTLWGSEFLIADCSTFLRAGHFSYFPLPGGESAIRDVWKIGLSLLYSAYGKDFPLMQKDSRTDILIQMIDRSMNSPLTCSIGRIFDGISAILGISHSVSTEAEAAVLLEDEAHKSLNTIDRYQISMDTADGLLVISTDDLVRYVADLRQQDIAISDISMAFHNAIAHTSVIAAVKLRELHSVNTVALSGGVFHNRIILRLMIQYLKDAGFNVLTPKRVPFNDQCIALGQLAIARTMTG